VLICSSLLTVSALQLTIKQGRAQSNVNTGGEKMNSEHMPDPFHVVAISEVTAAISENEVNTTSGREAPIGVAAASILERVTLERYTLICTMLGRKCGCLRELSLRWSV